MPAEHLPERTQQQTLRLHEDEQGELLELVRACPEAPSWPLEAWSTFLPPRDSPPCSTSSSSLLHNDDSGIARAMLAFRSGKGLSGIVAFAVLNEVTELELLLVHPAERRRGVGGVLAHEWLRWGERAGAKEAVLEVRATNAGAQALYRGLGFADQGRRPRYYNNPVEDAVLMHRIVNRPVEP